MWHALIVLQQIEMLCLQLFNATTDLNDLSHLKREIQLYNYTGPIPSSQGRHRISIMKTKWITLL
jgi:hypothetical protein